MPKITDRGLARLFKVLILLPFAYWLYLIFSDSLGADPAKTLNHATGEMAFYYLLLNLATGAWLSLMSWRPRTVRVLLLSRRFLGVTTFVILIFHMLLYLTLEGFEPQAFEQMLTKTYLILGSLAWLILLVLALTSNNFSVKRLGGKRWKRLHRLVYLASALISAHVLLIEKADLVKFGILLTLLWVVQITRFVRSMLVTKSAKKN